MCARNIIVDLLQFEKKVLELVWNSHKPIKAYDILAMLSTEDFVEKPPTVYRALEFLQENNLVHKIESQNAFIGCNHDHDSFDSKFLICDVCDEVEELTVPKLNKALKDICNKEGFIPKAVNVEIHGTCTQCAN